VPSRRLALAQQAFNWGDYKQARDEYAALLTDRGADAAERHQAAYWLGRSALEAGDYSRAVKSLQDFLKTYPDDSQSASALFLLARAYEGLADWRDAIMAYRRYLQADNLLAMYAYDGIGKAAMLLLDYDQAVEAYTDGVRVASDNTWLVYMREGIAQAQLTRNKPMEAVKQYDSILQVARLDAYRAKILYLAGQALAQANDVEAAHKRYAEAVDLYPATRYAYLSLVELVNAAVPVDDYQRGLVDYYADAYQPAIDALTRAIKSTQAVHGGDALWYLALSLKANGNLTQSIQRFQELIKTYPKNEHSTEAWLNIADAYALRGSTDQALSTYRTFADKFPTSPLASSALWEAAGLQVGSSDFTAAAATYRDLAKRFPRSEHAAEALFKAALLDYRRGDYEAARNGWRALVETYPDDESADGGRYWLGKAWLALSKADAAKSAFQTASQWSPESYYGVRASEMLAGLTVRVSDGDYSPPTIPSSSQVELDTWLASWLPITNTAVISQQLSPVIARSTAWRRGNALLEVGRRQDALDEFDAIRQTWWDDPLVMYQLAFAFRELGLYRLSILCAERLTWTSPVSSHAQVPHLLRQLSHPLYYADLVTAEAEAQGIDPLLLFTLIRQESLFEPSITSSADARGLAQVIPPTGEWIAGRLGWADWQAEDLWLPYVSVPFGAWYLRVQLATFDNQVVPALVAYNAGPGRVYDWLAMAPDQDLFVETIPYAEPRRYVRAIYEDYNQYRRLYRPGS
jgi:soluble lytic murein transglycosylase